MDLLKLLSTNEIVAQVIGFLLLLTLLRIFAWRRILKALDKRKDYISHQLKELESAKADIDKMKTEYAAKLADIEQAAKERVHQALHESKAILDDSRKNANIQAQEIIDSAKSSIKYELSKAKEDLKNDIIDMTIKAAESVIKEKLNAEADRRLVKDFLEEIKEG